MCLPPAIGVVGVSRQAPTGGWIDAVSVASATLPFMLENVTGLATSVSAVIAVLISSYVLRLQLRDKQLQRDREREPRWLAAL